jgi:hypothetical protein
MESANREDPSEAIQPDDFDIDSEDSEKVARRKRRGGKK